MQVLALLLTQEQLVMHTIGHGLGVTPQVWIVKQECTRIDWYVWHHQMAADNIVDNRMLINKTDALGTYTGINALRVYYKS